jgi:surface antigen
MSWMTGSSSLRSILAVAVAFVATVAFTIPAYADPPGHAPAHGWRAKHRDYEHEHHHKGGCRGYAGRQWPQDYGIYSGHCNRDAVGAVLGGVVGGAIGSTIGHGSDQAVAILVGGVLGAVVGHEIGRSMDERDRACFGHSLELADTGHSVSWVNVSTGVTYVVTPMGGGFNSGDPCRTFRMRAANGGRSETTEGRACRSGSGTWQIAGR